MFPAGEMSQKSLDWLIAPVGAGGGTGLCLARRYATSWEICSSVSESANGGIFLPPLRIWSDILAGVQSLFFRMPTSEGAFLPPTPPSPWQWAQPLSRNKIAPAFSAALFFEPQRACAGKGAMQTVRRAAAKGMRRRKMAVTKDIFASRSRVVLNLPVESAAE